MLRKYVHCSSDIVTLNCVFFSFVCTVTRYSECHNAHSTLTAVVLTEAMGWGKLATKKLNRTI